MMATNRTEDFSKSGYVTAIAVTNFGAMGGIVGLVTLVIAIVVIIARFSSL
jgi:hypothetical protein